MKIKLLVLMLSLLFCFNDAFSQDASTQQFQIKPYLGISLPQNDFKDFAESGSVFGIAIDKYISKRLALGVDFNYQSNKFSNPFDYSVIATSDMLSMNTNGNWSTTSFLFGPTYRLGRNKINVELYAKAGISILKTPSQSAVFSQSGIPDVVLLTLKDDNTTAFGFNSGIRINFAISKKLSVFFNPQYQFIRKDIEYFHRPITSEVISNPDALATDGGELCYIKPSYLNVNFGVTLNLGGNKTKKTHKEETELKEQDICNDTKLKSPYNGESYFADSDIVPEFSWINHSKPSAASYVFELFYGEKRLFEKTVKQPEFKFSKKMTSDFYSLEGTRDYSWRITTNYSNCAPTTTDFNYFTVVPRNTASRSACDLDFVLGDIYCSDPAYSETGTVKYIGTFTVTNNSSQSLPGVLIPHPNAQGPVQLFGTNNINASLTFSQGGFPSPCSATPMINTGNGPALRPNSSATFCFELEVPYGTNSIRFYAKMNTYDGGELPAECPEQFDVTLPVCACDACDTWDFTNKTHNSVYDSANNNPYLSHLIFQRFKLPGTAPIKHMKAEIVYVKHEVNDPKCYSCTAEAKDMGLFSAVNAKPKDILANPLDWVNQNEGILGLDKNNDGYSNMLNWQARNLVTGVDFASRDHNFNIYINLPGDNSFECCNHEYEVWIRYTFEDINCITCSTLIKYDLSTSSNSSGSSGIGSGGLNTGVSNQQGGLSPTQLTPKN